MKRTEDQRIVGGFVEWARRSWEIPVEWHPKQIEALWFSLAPTLRGETLREVATWLVAHAERELAYCRYEHEHGIPCEHGGPAGHQRAAERLEEIAKCFLAMGSAHCYDPEPEEKIWSGTAIESGKKRTLEHLRLFPIPPVASTGSSP